MSDIARAMSSALRLGRIIVSPESEWIRVMHRRRAISISAAEMRLQANRLPVIGISLKAINAAANCRRIDSVKTNITVIGVSSSPFPSYYLLSVR
jgi:hypothetical protein